MKKDKKALIAGTVVSVVGAIVMVGWVLDIAFLKSILPIWVTMKFSTALSFFLGGITLFFITRSLQGRKEIAQVILPITTLTILLLMVTLLASVFLNMRTGVEDLFVAEAEKAVKTTTPGRPSVGTMVNFILIALAGIMSILDYRHLRRDLFFLGVAIGIVATLAMIGYLFDVPFLYYTVEGFSTAMAFHTAILFALIGVGLTFAITARDNTTGNDV